MSRVLYTESMTSAPVFSREIWRHRRRRPRRPAARADLRRLRAAHRHLRHRQRQAVEQIRGGAMPFLEEGAEEMLRARPRRAACSRSTTTPELIGECRFLVLIIGTPVDEHLNPSFTAIDRALDALPAAPARRPDPDPAQHRLPRHQPAHPALPAPTGPRHRRGVLPGARRPGLQPARVPRAAADRQRLRRRRRSARCASCSAASPASSSR